MHFSLTESNPQYLTRLPGIHQPFLRHHRHWLRLPVFDRNGPAEVKTKTPPPGCYVYPPLSRNVLIFHYSCYSQACGSGYTESLLGTISSQSSQFCGAGAAPATTTTGGSGGAATSGASSPSVTAAASTTAGGGGGPSSSTSVGLAVHNVVGAPAGAVALGLFAVFL